jgi:hypothetical protein
MIADVGDSVRWSVIVHPSPRKTLRRLGRQGGAEGLRHLPGHSRPRIQAVARFPGEKAADAIITVDGTKGEQPPSASGPVERAVASRELLARNAELQKALGILGRERRLGVRIDRGSQKCVPVFLERLGEYHVVRRLTVEHHIKEHGTRAILGQPVDQTGVHRPAPWPARRLPKLPHRWFIHVHEHDVRCHAG